MDVLGAALDDLREALDRQCGALLRKVESLRQLGRTGTTAMAGTLAGAGLLAQAQVPFPPAALSMLTAGILAVLVAIAWSVASASLADGLDIPVGPDPEVLRLLEEDRLDEDGLAASRFDLTVRMHGYMAVGLERTSNQVRRVLVLLMSGSFLVLAGFFFVLGGAIL